MKKKPFYNQHIIATGGDLWTTLAHLMLLVPKNLVSWVTGVLVRVKLPRALSVYLLRGFSSLFHIDMSEAEKPLEDYETIEDLFTRSLKEGSRKIEGPVCSPSDGVLARSLRAENSTLVQAKGIEYPLEEIVFGERADFSNDRGLDWFFTIYLAPHNYHRVHSPVSGHLVGLRYLPGELWPVNAPFVRRIPRLFSRNERLVFDIELEGGGRVHVVMVGAFNVGRISSLHLPGFVTNSFDRQFGARVMAHTFDSAIPLTAGDEIGTFLLGSTVVVAFDSKASAKFPLMHCEENTPILMGKKLSQTT